MVGCEFVISRVVHHADEDLAEEAAFYTYGSIVCETATSEYLDVGASGQLSEEDVDRIE